jgi:bifunctional non-homologous end joining protein LigD
MAATLTQDRFTGPEWIFERKYDGIRLLAFRKSKTVRLFSRNQLPQNYPAIADVVGALPVDQVILDGEVDWGDRNLEYHVFDVLWLNGRDLMPEEDVVGIGPVVVQAFPDAAWTCVPPFAS